MNKTEQFARTLRKESTTAEQLLWQRLRSSQLHNLKFRRQHAFGQYILDFYCPKYYLVIEVDGDVHAFDSKQRSDRVRNNYLIQNGLTLLHVTNNDVYENIEGVLERIMTLTPLRLNSFEGQALTLSLEGRGVSIYDADYGSKV